MTVLTLASIPGTDPGLKDALVSSGLPIEDLDHSGRSFFCATNQAGDVVGYSGIEVCGGDVLLRSVVILSQYRGQNFGALIVLETLASVSGNSAVYLATNSAAPFFERLGFTDTDRADVPAAIMATRQLSSICPASAKVMKLKLPPS